ncbi:MAG TPA: gephyrin-like molybdotransferase Glp [Gemmatimonadaceae bacterium]|nr:gephyrin-like molybdotransferase Glp [Gemmatimonadaceae bacterium]
MLEPADAARRIVAAIAPIPAVNVALSNADGLVLADDVVSPVSLPLWANSAMDGYACRADDVKLASAAAPVSLAVVDNVRAGAFPSRAISAGQATRIATGAPVPDGADSVVRVEDTDAGAKTVVIRDARDAGRNIRPAGEDVRAGDVVVRAGTELRAAHIAILASVGAANVRVHRRPRVAIVTSGDELVALDRFDEVRAGKRIVSSNSYGLAAAIRDAGGEPVDLGIIADDRAALRAALERAADCDLVISSAGVSVGEADHMRAVVAELGGALDFWRVRMRPGSPLAFGTIRDTPWLGLPGNPVSALVTFELFARPAIRRLLGHRRVYAARTRVITAEAMTTATGLTHYLRVRLDRNGSGPARATLTGPQPSNILSSMSRADALLIVPAEHAPVRIGDALDAILLGDAVSYHDEP